MTTLAHTLQSLVADLKGDTPAERIENLLTSSLDADDVDPQLSGILGMLLATPQAADALIQLATMPVDELNAHISSVAQAVLALRGSRGVTIVGWNHEEGRPWDPTKNNERP